MSDENKDDSEMKIKVQVDNEITVPLKMLFDFTEKVLTSVVDKFGDYEEAIHFIQSNNVFIYNKDNVIKSYVIPSCTCEGCSKLSKFIKDSTREGKDVTAILASQGIDVKTFSNYDTEKE